MVSLNLSMHIHGILLSGHISIADKAALGMPGLTQLIFYWGCQVSNNFAMTDSGASDHFGTFVLLRVY